ncbi:MAG: hypothetical protein US35_C0014G0019 [Parcubacteria group bacterium GW2011_GWA2_37_10]|nr:MAG: hypothetical protein US35_C0014G0019 [Parcubacteria group bacterium GW2011_GWA2_37_10]
MEEFSGKQVLILVATIVIGIAFVETSSPMWTSLFWREFLLKVLIYGAVSEFMVIATGSFLPNLFKK